MATEPALGAVEFHTQRRSLRGVRVRQAAPRWLFVAVCILGLLSSVRFALAPPRPVIHPTAAAPALDPGAASYAQRFAVALLSYDGASPDAHHQALASYLGSSGALGADGGLVPPDHGTQTVAASYVAQTRPGLLPGEHVFTIAAQTSASGTVYLSVGVTRDAGGALGISGYPAIVGAPANAPASDGGDNQLESVSDPALRDVVDRVLRNYLSGQQADVQADLAPGSTVSMPEQTLTYGELTGLRWAPDHTGVEATLTATDAHGAGWTCRYAIDVRQQAGRWYVAAIQTLPTS